MREAGEKKDGGAQAGERGLKGNGERDGPEKGEKVTGKKRADK